MGIWCANCFLFICIQLAKLVHEDDHANFSSVLYFNKGNTWSCLRTLHLFLLFRITPIFYDNSTWEVRLSFFSLDVFKCFRFLIHSSHVLLLKGDPTIFGNLVPPDEVIEAVVTSVRSMKFNGYAPSTGKHWVLGPDFVNEVIRLSR